MYLHSDPRVHQFCIKCLCIVITDGSVSSSSFFFVFLSFFCAVFGAEGPFLWDPSRTVAFISSGVIKNASPAPARLEQQHIPENIPNLGLFYLFSAFASTSYQMYGPRAIGRKRKGGKRRPEKKYSFFKHWMLDLSLSFTGKRVVFICITDTRITVKGYRVVFIICLLSYFMLKLRENAHV